MKRFLFAALTILFASNLYAQNDYFFPSGIEFDENIPSPQQYLGYSIGDWHTRHDRIVSYMFELASSSENATIQTIGFTNEQRPQVVLTITSSQNHQNLENIRKEHLAISDPTAPEPDYSQMPAVIVLGYNVHGNEPSSSEAAMLTAYYLLAAQNEETKTFLENAVIMIDPAYNPDGRDRHTQWVNSHKGFPPVADPNDREHNEVWPGGRTNHYWFDLNRDWLPLAHVESRNRIEFYHQWLPNVGTDFHEMGTDATYFFEPTKPYGSENPVVPRSNYDTFNNLFAPYFAEVLDEMGSLYFTKEVFDNSYPGYGSTYQDIHGGLGLVFEQASSRGHKQQSDTKEVTFAFTIRNHTRTGIATVRAGVENREFMLRHQRDFFKSAVSEASRDSKKAWVYSSDDPARMDAFSDLLLRHRIKTYKLNSDISTGRKTYRSANSLVVPTNQPQYRMVRSMFESVTDFYDSVFYDASTWTMALAYNMEYDAVESKISVGDEINRGDLYSSAGIPAMAEYAYLVEWNQFYAPRFLYYLLERGVNVKTAFKKFSAQVNGSRKDFGYGSLMISTQDQTFNKESLNEIINSAVQYSNVAVDAVNTGFSLDGIDLGSNNFRTVDVPKVLMIIGEGVSGYESGEVWFMMDSKIGMPITKVDIYDFGRVNLFNYNTLIMVSGGYNSLGDEGATRINDWVINGGTLLAMRTAVNWAVNNKVGNQEFEKFQNKNEESRRDYVTSREYSGSNRIGGSIYLADIDNTHPLGFGYTSRQIPVYRNHSLFLKDSKSPYSNVIKYSSDPLLSGYINDENLEKLRNRTSLIATNSGRGNVILMCDNPNFRGYWYGTSKVFFNAVFFGGLY